MDATPKDPDGPGFRPLPMARGAVRGGPEARDLARGRLGLVAWGAPIALILVASALVSASWFPEAEAGLLLVLGTAWLGGTCLVNGLRCGRVHCLVDGTLLPGLAAVGALDLLSVVFLPWNAYEGTLWLIVLSSFAVECIVGPYAPGAAVRA